MSKKKEFWVANISTSKDISISDLAVIVRRGKCINLLDFKRYRLTEEQVKNSYETGSIKRKSNVLKVRKKAVVVPKTTLDIEKNPRVLRKSRGYRPLDEPHFEELDIESELSESELRSREEKDAQEAAEADFNDRAPLLSVDPKYKEV